MKQNVNQGKSVTSQPGVIARGARESISTFNEQRWWEAIYFRTVNDELAQRHWREGQMSESAMIKSMTTQPAVIARGARERLSVFDEQRWKRLAI